MTAFLIGQMLGEGGTETAREMRDALKTVAIRAPRELSEQIEALLEAGVDLPASADAQVDWLRSAGFRASIAHERDDLAVLVAVR